MQSSESPGKDSEESINVDSRFSFGMSSVGTKTMKGLVVRPPQQEWDGFEIDSEHSNQNSEQNKLDVGESVHALLEWHYHHLKEKTALNALGVKTACHSVLFVFAVVLAISGLQLVIIPLIFAGFFAVTLEPVAFFLLDCGVPLCNNPVSFGRAGARRETNASRQPSVQAPGADDEEDSIDSDDYGGLKNSRDSDDHSVLQYQHDSVAGNSSQRICDVILLSVVRRGWIVIIVWSCIVGLLSVFVAIILAVIGSFQSVPWEKYLESERVQGLMAMARRAGVDLMELGPTILPWLMEGALLEIMDNTMQMLSGMILMILFLVYWLIHNLTERLQQKFGLVPNEQEPRLQKKLELVMRMYIIQKTYLSLLKAVMVGLLFFFLQVDLWFIWALLTFVLNYIPLGSAVATILPVMFVIFDPTKSLTDVIVCACVPVAIHNIVGNLVEPKMFADSLNLHPITVLLSLAFWSVVWGVFGALLSVPLSAAFRIILLEMHEHPFALPVVKLMEAKHVPPQKRIKMGWASPHRSESESTIGSPRSPKSQF